MFLYLSVFLWINRLANKCPIKKTTGKAITGYNLLVHDDFKDSVKAVDKAAKDCEVHVYVTGSYYQLSDPNTDVSYNDADLAIGHGFKFQLREENDAILCNELCLSKSKINIIRYSHLVLYT